MEVFKISSNSETKAIAGALAAAIRQNNQTEIHAIGAGAVSQALKGIIVTRGFVAPNGIDLVVIPAFMSVNLDGEDRTAIKFIIERR